MSHDVDRDDENQRREEDHDAGDSEPPASEPVPNELDWTFRVVRNEAKHSLRPRCLRKVGRTGDRSHAGRGQAAKCRVGSLDLLEALLSSLANFTIRTTVVVGVMEKGEASIRR